MDWNGHRNGIGVGYGCWILDFLLRSGRALLRFCLHRWNGVGDFFLLLLLFFFFSSSFPFFCAEMGEGRREMKYIYY